MKVEVPHLPTDDECRDGKFIHVSGMKLFRGQKLPSHFEVFASDEQDLADGQWIGRTRFNQKLYWVNNQVVAKG